MQGESGNGWGDVLQGKRGVTEGALLHLAVGVAAVKFPMQKPHETVREAAGVSKPTFSRAFGDEGHLGGAAWRRIEKLLGMEIYQQWVKGL